MTDQTSVIIYGNLLVYKLEKPKKDLVLHMTASRDSSDNIFLPSPHSTSLCVFVKLASTKYGLVSHGSLL